MICFVCLGVLLAIPLLLLLGTNRVEHDTKRRMAIAFPTLSIEFYFYKAQSTQTRTIQRRAMRDVFETRQNEEGRELFGLEFGVVVVLRSVTTQSGSQYSLSTRGGCVGLCVWEWNGDFLARVEPGARESFRVVSTSQNNRPNKRRILYRTVPGTGGNEIPRTWY